MTTAIAGREGDAARWLRLVPIGLGMAIVPLDSAVNIGFPDITRSFDLPIAMIQWVVVSYVLTHAALMLAFGRIGDLWSHGLVFRLGLGWSAAAFLLCAAAPSYAWLLFFRVLQGIGAGLVISCAPALVTRLYPEERRAQALGTFAMLFAVASALGPLLGGALVQRWGWPAVFWFRAPIALAALALARGLPPPAAARGSETLDIVGAVLLALALSLLLFAVNQASRLAAGDYWMLPLFAVSLAAFAGFVGWERRVARPIVRVELFRMPGFALVNAGNLLIALCSFSVMLLVPYFLARFGGFPLVLAGAVLAGGSIAMAATSPLAGRLVARLSPARVAPAGALLVGTGLFLAGGWTPATGVAAMLAALALQGIGSGFFQVAYMEIVMATLPPQHRGVAGSLAMLTRTAGTVTGATALTVIFRAAEGAAATAGASSADAFLAAFGTTFRIAGIAAGIVGIVIALTARARR
jgi:EmrB/QacA subfamily drug resistance transporter